MLCNLNESLNMSALSKLAGISTSNFYHLFKLATGSTPNVFFVRARMNHARKLLCSTNLSVKEVAFSLGYDDPFYFSRVFKSVHRVAPSYYRSSQVRLADPMAFSSIRNTHEQPTSQPVRHI